LERIKWLRDLSATEWVSARLHPFGRDVGSVIPDQFESYARIFHAFPPTDGPSRHGFTGSLPASIRKLLIEKLRDETGTPDRCWFCFWDGWGGLDDQGVKERFTLPGRSFLVHSGPIEMALSPPPRFPAATMNATMRTGREPAIIPVSTTDDQSASSWWPNDRKWFVATDIDDSWSFVGGSRKLIDKISADDRIDARTTSPTDALLAPLGG
jgi:hypothetical protein